MFNAERWLTPGTEYAVPEKLPLPREWYKDWETNADAGENGAMTGADVDESSKCACCALCHANLSCNAIWSAPCNTRGWLDAYVGADSVLVKESEVAPTWRQADSWCRLRSHSQLARNGTMGRVSPGHAVD